MKKKQKIQLPVNNNTKASIVFSLMLGVLVLSPLSCTLDDLDRIENFVKDKYTIPCEDAYITVLDTRTDKTESLEELGIIDKFYKFVSFLKEKRYDNYYYRCWETIEKGFSVTIDGSSTGENEILSPYEMLMNFIWAKCVMQDTFNSMMAVSLVNIAKEYYPEPAQINYTIPCEDAYITVLDTRPDRPKSLEELGIIEKFHNFANFLNQFPKDDPYYSKCWETIKKDFQ